MANWFRYPKEVANSLTREGFFDLNVDAAAWLVHFKLQNAQLMTHFDVIRSSRNFDTVTMNIPTPFYSRCS